MRPQQQNRRMRGRGNNNSGGSNNNNNRNKGGNQNPLSRSYESNGPDVKIRGNAQQIAEKYSTLARDAQSSGDRVMAENYLQHAEHYNRIIAAAQASMPIQNFQQNRDDFDDEDGEDFDGQGNEQGEGASVDGNGPQPVIEGVPAEVALNGDANGQGDNRQRQRDGNFRNNREGRDRNNRNRDYQGRNGSGNGDYQRRDFQPRDGEGQDQPAAENQAETFVAQEPESGGGDSLPAFVTGGAPAPREVQAPREDSAPRRSRRPRRGEQRAEGDASQDSPTGEAGGEVLVTSED